MKSTAASNRKSRRLTHKKFADSRSQSQVPNGTKNKTIVQNRAEANTRPSIQRDFGRIDLAPVDIHPKGLVNPNNKCFLNTILQVLIFCAPFYSLVRDIKNNKYLNKNKFLVFNLWSEFFDTYCPNKRLESDEESAANNELADASIFYGFVDSFSDGEYQEDAQEFLFYLLDRMHSELTSICAANTGGEGAVDDDDQGWSIVTRNNRVVKAPVYATSSEESLITKIFNGKIQCIYKIGDRASTTSQPFNGIHLDINNQINSLEEGLDFYFRTEVMNNDSGIHTTNTFKFEELPPVLIIHLKRFHFDNGKIFKICKLITIPDMLEIKDSWTSNSKDQMVYELHSVISHKGKSTDFGHYTCDILLKNKNQWMNIDDEEITPINKEKVLNNPDAYLLIYIITN